jgi:hypothetical protein
VARIIEEVFDLGDSGGKQRAPGEAMDFDVAVRSFIPPPWIDGPDGCGFGGRDVIYKGDKRSFQRLTWDVRTHSAVHLLPDQGSFGLNSKYNLTGQTRRYDKATGLGADGVTVLDDSVLHDC